MTNYDPFNADQNEKRSKRRFRKNKRDNKRNEGRVPPTSTMPTNSDSKSSRKQKVSGSFEQKRKSKKPLAITLLIIVLLYSTFHYDIEYFIENKIDDYKVNNFDAVEDYSFSLDDFNHDDSFDKYFNVEPGTGESIDFTQLYNPLELAKYDMYQTKFTVGTDVEPGLYSITLNGEVLLEVDSLATLDVDGYDNDQKTFYNIPLVEGDELSITSTDKDDYGLTLTKQNDYKQYESGDCGIYIYGLSNFDPYLHFDDATFVTYRYFSEEGYLEYYNPPYGEEFTAKGIPGSLVTIEK